MIAAGSFSLDCAKALPAERNKDTSKMRLAAFTPDDCTEARRSDFRTGVIVGASGSVHSYAEAIWGRPNETSVAVSHLREVGLLPDPA